MINTFFSRPNLTTESSLEHLALLTTLYNYERFTPKGFDS